MHSNIEKLMNGDKAVPEYFAAAKGKWSEILSDLSTVSINELAERLSSAQIWFEHHCGGRWDGQEVMVWTGFASLYSTEKGYAGSSDANGAVKLAEAFAASMVSVEVKGGAAKAAKSYYLEIINGKYRPG